MNGFTSILSFLFFLVKLSASVLQCRDVGGELERPQAGCCINLMSTSLQAVEQQATLTCRSDW